MNKVTTTVFFLLSGMLTGITSVGACITPTDRQQVPKGCTVITLSKGDSVFFGGNDDYINPDSYYWVEPGDSTKFGVIWFGTPDNPQQGINEKGLAYDANGLPRVDVNPHTERIPVSGDYPEFITQILHKCATVKEAIAWANSHQHFPYMHDQLQFADATGDAVIISAGKDGEMVFTRKKQGDGFIVSTNFNVANPSNGYGYPDWRYDLAQKNLGELIDKKGPVGYRDVTNVMDAVHVDKGSSWTIETIVADLVNRVVYVYFFYQYDHPVVLHVDEELAHPRAPGPLSKLFPLAVQQEAARRYKKGRFSFTVNRVTGIAWPSLIAVSLLLLFTACRERKREIRIWLPATVVFGPFALLGRAWFIHRCKTERCRQALLETAGNTLTVTVMFTIAVTLLITSMMSGGVTVPFQALILFGLPLAGVWVLHVLFLLPYREKNLFHLIIVRLPQVIITTFLGLAGIIAIAMPLINKNLNMSMIVNHSPLVILTWWAFTVLGALPGGILIFLFERWEVKRGYLTWTVFSHKTGRVSLAGWKTLWWWILVSIIILVAGMILAVKGLR